MPLKSKGTWPPDMFDPDEPSVRKPKQNFTIDREVLERFRNRYGNGRRMSKIVENLIRWHLDQLDRKVVPLSQVPQPITEGEEE